MDNGYYINHRHKLTLETFILKHRPIFPEPVILVGEGQYNLNVLKEIEATESFIKMETGCKKEKEPVFDCITKKYKAACSKTCGCLPLRIGFDKTVYISL